MDIFFSSFLQWRLIASVDEVWDYSGSLLFENILTNSHTGCNLPVCDVLSHGGDRRLLSCCRLRFHL